MLTRNGPQSAVCGDVRFAVTNGLFVQFALNEVVVHDRSASQTECRHSIFWIMYSEFFHRRIPFSEDKDVEIFTEINPPFKKTQVQKSE
jgi:hypothetical protein